MSTEPPYGPGHPAFDRAVELAHAAIGPIARDDNEAFGNILTALQRDTGRQGGITAMLAWCDLLIGLYPEDLREQAASGGVVPVPRFAVGGAAAPAAVSEADPALQFAARLVAARFCQDTDMCQALISAIPGEELHGARHHGRLPLSPGLPERPAARPPDCHPRGRPRDRGP